MNSITEQLLKTSTDPISKIVLSDEFNIFRVKKNKIECSFIPFCKGGYSMSIHDDTMDAEDILTSFTPQEQYVWKLLKKCRTSNMLVSNKSSMSLTKTEQNRFNLGYKRLNAKDVLRRVKRNVYMINPKIIATPTQKEDYVKYTSL